MSGPSSGEVVVLAGGGLANTLIAWRLRARRPTTRVILLESGGQLGGNHTWSFHGADLTAAQHVWFAPLVERSWLDHELRFPGRQRRIDGKYHSLTGAHLHRVVSAALGDAVQTGAVIESVGPHEARLRDGRVVGGDTVIDGRGADGLPGMDVRWQKFVGQELRLAQPHDFARPVLMDATVPQEDGFRFIYVLPLAPDRLLVEDTRYSDGSRLDAAVLRQGIADYTAKHNLRIAAIEREEQGVLPIVLDGDIDRFWSTADPAVPRSGVRAGLFHMTTGYSLPAAVEFADALADAFAGRPMSSAALAPWVRAYSRRHWRSQAFFRLLNRMLFLAAKPDERRGVLEHFYRLPDDVIGRFYAGRPGWRDRLRILSGSPPVPMRRALRSALRPARSASGGAA